MQAHKASRIPGLGCRAVARCAVVCCSCSLNRMNPRVSPRVSVRVVSLIISSMAATQSPDQLSAWFGLSSCSSRVSPRASARGVSLITPSMTAAYSPNQSNAWVGLSSSCWPCGAAWRRWRKASCTPPKCAWLGLGSGLGLELGLGLALGLEAAEVRRVPRVAPLKE